MMRTKKREKHVSGAIHSPSKTVRFRFYPMVLYHRLDRWLGKMSKKGWQLYHCGFFLFYFEKSEPKERLYFTYYSPMGGRNDEGQYVLELLHPFFEKKYGLKLHDSRINSDKHKKYDIVEIDPKKISGPNFVSFSELVRDRDRLYLKYWLIHFLIPAIIIGVICFFIF